MAGETFDAAQERRIAAMRKDLSQKDPEGKVQSHFGHDAVKSAEYREAQRRQQRAAATRKRLQEQARKEQEERERALSERAKSSQKQEQEKKQSDLSKHSPAEKAVPSTHREKAERHYAQEREQARSKSHEAPSIA